MRLLALILILTGLAATGLAAQSLWQVLQAEAERTSATDAATTTGTAQPPAPPRATRRWPALFGERQPPTPQPATPPPTAEPQPPKTPRPPLASLGYTLQGVVRSGQSTWAIVAHPTGQRLLEEGQELDPGIVVARIDEQGLWLSREGDTPELLAFPD